MLRARRGKLTSFDCCLLLSYFEWVGFLLFLFFLLLLCHSFASWFRFFNSKPGSKPKSCTLPQKILAWLTTTKSRFTLSVPPRLGWDGCITPKGHTDALKKKCRAVTELWLYLNRTASDLEREHSLHLSGAEDRCPWGVVWGLFFLFLPHKDNSLFYILLTAVLRSLCCWVASESRPQHWLWED